MLQPNSAHFTRASISYHETERIMQDLALKLGTDCSVFQSTKNKSPVKCYMYPANSRSQRCHRKLPLMGSSENSPSNYGPRSWGRVVIEEHKNHRKLSTPEHRMGLAPVRAGSLGAVLSHGLLTPGEEADLVSHAGVYCYGSPGSTNQLQTAAMINPYVLEM